MSILMVVAMLIKDQIILCVIHVGDNDEIFIDGRSSNSEGAEIVGC